jgi:hypothetical protein
MIAHELKMIKDMTGQIFNNRSWHEDSLSERGFRESGRRSEKFEGKQICFEFWSK